MSRAFVELVAAVGPRWELGYQGGMPWPRIKGDLALFRQVTAGKAVIMGRRTWESSPPAHRPLKHRANVVLSRSAVLNGGAAAAMREAGAAHVVLSLESAMRRMSEVPESSKGVIIIGGAEVYRAALEADLVDVVHLSVIHHPEGWPHDVTSPALGAAGWVVAERHTHAAEGGASHGWTQMRLVRDPLHPALGGEAWALEGV